MSTIEKPAETPGAEGAVMEGGETTDQQRSLRRGKAVAALASLVLIGATVAPIAENWRPLDDRKDNFPFSYYPMFSAKRDEEYRVSYLVGLTAKGNRKLLSYHLAGVGLNQTRRQINKRIREGDAQGLCEDVAAKLAKESQKKYRNVVVVRVVTGWYRFDEYFGGNKKPIRERIHASCRVMREGEK